MHIALNDAVHLIDPNADGWFIDGSVSDVDDEGVDVDFGEVVMRFNRKDIKEHVEYYTQARVLTPTSDGEVIEDYRPRV